MALYLSISSLKEIKSIYTQLGISNSDVLDQITTAINMNHFNREACEEIIDIFDEYEKALEHEDRTLTPAQKQVLAQVRLLARIHEKAKDKVRV